jgi:hypothetical protein
MRQMHGSGWAGKVGPRMKKKADRPTGTVETFAEESSLETCLDGSLLLR